MGDRIRLSRVVKARADSDTGRKWRMTNGGCWRKRSSRNSMDVMTPPVVAGDAPLSCENPRFNAQPEKQYSIVLFELLQIEDVYRMCREFTGIMGKTLRQLNKGFDNIVCNLISDIELMIHLSRKRPTTILLTLDSLLLRLVQLHKVSFTVHFRYDWKVEFELSCNQRSGMHVEQISQLILPCFSSANTSVVFQGIIDKLSELQTVVVRKLSISHCGGPVNEFVFLDLDKLESLKSLRQLEIRDVEIFRLSTLHGCTSLRFVDFTASKIESLAKLGKCKNIRKIILTGTNIADVSSLGNCTALTTLDLQTTEVSDVTALGTCVSLTQLDLSFTNVSDVSPLSNCLKLSKLFLKGTQVIDISALGNCRSLRNLNLWNTPVSDITPLVGCESLLVLNLQLTPVADVGALGMCKSLVELNLTSTKVTHVSGLENCTSLSILHLEDTEVEDLEALLLFKPDVLIKGLY